MIQLTVMAHYDSEMEWKDFPREYKESPKHFYFPFKYRVQEGNEVAILKLTIYSISKLFVSVLT